MCRVDGARVKGDVIGFKCIIYNLLLFEFRWTEVAKQLGIKFTNLIGDVLVSSGVVAYLGAFTAAFRQVKFSGV